MISYCAVTTVKYFFLLFFQLLPVIRVVFNFRVELLWFCFTTYTFRCDWFKNLVRHLPNVCARRYSLLK